MCTLEIAIPQTSTKTYGKQKDIKKNKAEIWGEQDVEINADSWIYAGSWTR